MKVGLYFGTYNPIHIGHLAIANYMVEYTEIDQLWFVVSPHNPFKIKKHLLDDDHRLEMVSLAIDNDPRFRACDVEFNLPHPSYTIDTLNHLKGIYPTFEFLLIIGSDNLESFHKWKSYELILQDYKILVYPRPGVNSEKIINHPNVQLVKAPLMEISASFIRKAIFEERDIRHFLPPNVWQYLNTMNFYR